MATLEQCLDQLASTDHRRATERWRAEVPLVSAEDRARATRLAESWVAIAQCLPAPGSQLAYVWIRTLWAESVSRAIPVRLVRFGARVLMRFPYRRVVDSLVSTMLRPPEAREQALIEIAGHWRRVESERAAASATFQTLLPSLRATLGLVAPTLRRLGLTPLRCAPWNPTARTDGQAISLPARVAVSPDPELNHWVYASLLVHELAHVQEGTFRFSFRTDAGKEVLRRLEPRRALFLEQRASWSADSLVDVQNRKGWLVRKPEKMPDLHAFTLHFENPRAAYGIFNALEDKRVDAASFARFEGLRAIRRRWEAAVAHLGPEPVFESLEQNFFRALLSRLTGRAPRGLVATRYRALWEEIGEALSRHEREAVPGAESSALLTIELYDILGAASKGVKGEAFTGFEQWGTHSADEVILKLEALCSETYDPARAIPWPYVQIPEQDPPMEGPWKQFAEYDIWEDIAIERASRVREVRWQPTITDDDPAQCTPAMAPNTSTAMRGSSGRSTRHDYEGGEIDMMSLFDMVASQRAGFSTDGRIFLRPRDEGLLISIVVDLTVSMRARRKSLRAPLAIDRAKWLANRWAAAWHRRVPTAVFGANDFGRRSVTLYRVKDWSERYDASRIRSLHSLGYSGFRFGAIVRYLDARARSSFGRAARHVVVLLTDCGSHYLSEGMDRILTETLPGEQCYRCPHGERCEIEPAIPVVRPPKSRITRIGMYYPTFYELADLRHALLSSPRVVPFVVFLDRLYDLAAVRRQLPRGDCAISLTPRNAPQLDRTLIAGLHGGALRC